MINHTLMSTTIRRVRVKEGRRRSDVNARVAGCLGVPVALLTGDDRVCAAASDAFPGIEVAPVKWAIDRLSAEHSPSRRPGPDSGACDGGRGQP